MPAHSVLILMSDTGGGHRASANALQDAFGLRYPGQFRIAIVDLLIDHLAWPLNRLPKSYNFLATQATGLWRGLWWLGERRRLAGVMQTAAARISTRQLQAVFVNARPDLVVSTHPLVQGMTLFALRRLGLHTPFATVVTDLATAHPLWFDPGVELCFVASPEAHRRARQAGLAASQIRLTGLPIRPAFAETPRAKPALRRELGLALDLPAALLLGGGEGMGPVAEIALAVAAALAGPGGAQGQLVVVCGRNRKLRDILTAQDWPIPVHVAGFVENMADWMAACDCIVTKAGPGSIAEALSQGLPIILSGFIPGQEEGNVPYVVENGAGVYCSAPSDIAGIVCRWFGNERSQLSQMAEQARRLGHPAAVFDIVDALAHLVDPAMVPVRQDSRREPA